MLAFLLAVIVTGGLAAEDVPFARGAVTDGIQCGTDKNQTWDLYLPSNYDPARKWPILYCLDPRGRGSVPLDLFRSAAEKYGWIIASSNNSASDAPMQVSADALKAIWIDSLIKLSIDKSRIYVAGFSGTARFAAVADRLIGPVRGVIGASAGFPKGDPPPDPIPYSYFVTAGRHDFNYYEVREFQRTLGSLHARYHVAYFDGLHQWPPASVATEAVEWMQLQAMRDKLLPADDAWIGRLLQSRSEAASRLMSDGRPGEALAAYDSIVRDFGGLGVDLSAVKAELAKLNDDKAVQRAIKASRERDESDLEVINRDANILSTHVAPKAKLVSPDTLARKLQIDTLLERAGNKAHRDDADSAARILQILGVQTAFYMPHALIQRGDFDHAELLAMLGTRILPERPGAWYELAVVETKAGRQKEAIRALRQAIHFGIRNVDAIRNDPDLAPLRGNKEFEALLGEVEPEM